MWILKKMPSIFNILPHVQLDPRTLRLKPMKETAPFGSQLQVHSISWFRSKARDERKTQNRGLAGSGIQCWCKLMILLTAYLFLPDILPLSQVLNTNGRAFQPCPWNTWDIRAIWVPTALLSEVLWLKHNHRFTSVRFCLLDCEYLEVSQGLCLPHLFPQSTSQDAHDVVSDK